MTLGLFLDSGLKRLAASTSCLLEHSLLESICHAVRKLETCEEAICRPLMSSQPKPVWPASHGSEHFEHPAPLSLWITLILPVVWLQPHKSLPPTWGRASWAQPTHRTVWDISSYCTRHLLGPFSLEIHLLSLWEIFFYYFFDTFFLPLFCSMPGSPVNQVWDFINWFSKPLICFHILNLSLVLFS